MTDQYEERFCAYIDILGFTELVASLRKEPTKVETIKRILDRVHNHDRHTPVELAGSNFRTQSISDAVALSTNPTILGFTILVRVISDLFLDLLAEGYFIRGAICKGPLYHDEVMVFGEAFITAYRLESEVALYPRVMVTKTVIDEAFGPEYTVQYRKFDYEPVMPASDGPFFLNILRDLRGILHDFMLARGNESDAARYYPLALEPYMKMHKVLQQKLIESVDTPRHFEKARWFAEYWNDTVGYGIGAEFHINGPGLKTFLAMP
jgi:hypothetical protein